MDDSFKKEITSLIVKVGKGDERALISLYEKTAARLMSVALALLHNRQDAEDAVSETFVRIVRYASSYKKSDNGYGWLATITRNCVNDIFHKRRQHVNIDDIVFLGTDGGISEQAQDVAAALDKLNEEERKLIYLRYYCDITVRDIANELRQPRSTVMYKLQKAERKLRGLLCKRPDE